MRKYQAGLFLLFNSLLIQGALADVSSETEEPGVAGDDTLTSTTEAEEVTRGYLKNEVFSFKPQLGVLNFKDPSGNSTTRAAGGMTIDANLAPSLLNSPSKSLYFGPSTGVLYTHLGDPTSNLIGTNADSPVGNSGANLLVIPANLKLGYNINELFRVSVHGGGNVIYRSIANSMNLGPTSADTASTWNLYPNVGGDVEIGLSRSASILLRPDWTLTPGNSIFMGTVAVGIPLG